jgi:hypothetical protein
MEFFAVAQTEMSPLVIQRAVDIARLPELCASIDSVMSQQGERGEIYCSWGQFKVHRELIRQGVRFSLPGCPNALQWTITSDGTDNQVRVHVTIDRDRHDEDFVASLAQFVEHWKNGLEQYRPVSTRAVRKSRDNCLPSYG